jgi:hypothetical protein
MGCVIQLSRRPWKICVKIRERRAADMLGSPAMGDGRDRMLPLTKEQEATLGLELATKRQEHADLDAAIHTLTDSNVADQMLIQRLKKRKLHLKDRIVQLENILLPDIIA